MVSNPLNLSNVRLLAVSVIPSTAEGSRPFFGRILRPRVACAQAPMGRRSSATGSACAPRMARGASTGRDHKPETPPVTAIYRLHTSEPLSHFVQFLGFARNGRKGPSSVESMVPLFMGREYRT